MEFALGVLQWTPEAFWQATPLELTSAYVGHSRRHGLGRWQMDAAGFNAESAEEMRKAFQAQVARDGRESAKHPRQMTKEQKREYKATYAQGGGVIRG